MANQNVHYFYLIMENQQSVFYHCPFAHQQFSNYMQQIQLDANRDTIETTIDVCLHLTYFRNLTENKMGPVQIVISVLSGESSIAIPYQIISNKSYNTTSKIDLETYTSPLYVLQPRENSIIDEMIIFKTHIPIDLVEIGRTKITIGLYTVNQLSFDKDDQVKRLDQVQLNFSSILYIDSFFPCTFNSYGITLEGNIFTHLLSCKNGHLSNIYRHHFYQAIDHLVICYNKLREKIDTLQKLSPQSYINSQDLPAYIDMKKHQQYQQIKGFIEKRIFQQQTMKEHKKVLHHFFQKFVPYMTEKLLILWKYFLKMYNFSMTENAKKQFYESLTLELKKRVQYKPQMSLTARSQIQNKCSRLSNSTSQNSQLGNSSRSQVSQSCSLVQCQMAENDLKQRFNDKSIGQPFRKLYVSNLQLLYPSIKVVVNKSLKNSQKDDVLAVSQPHIVVFVHGLGATSNAFSQFQANMKNVFTQNLFILNPTCNQSSTDQQMPQMGRKLAIQVYQFIVQNNFGQNFQLSFIGHSLGGLIIRSALPRLQMFKFNMKTLITLSTPHLGYFYHNSNLNKAGMWAISKFSNNQIINNLLMSDSQNQRMDEETGFRNSYLYTLSAAPGMGWFQHVMFCGSSQDYFVSPLSAFATTKQSIRKKDTLKSQIWQQMRLNIQSYIGESNIYRLLVQFNQQQSQTSLKDQILGRTSHIMYLSSQDFITYLLLVYKVLFV